MAWTYESILAAQAQRLEADRAQALAELEAARIYEDVSLMNTASDNLMRIDRDYAQLSRYATNMVQQQQTPRNQFGLSDDEVAIARTIGEGRRDLGLTDEARERLYAENKQKYQRMRATGEYRDDQGTVRR
ncbi:MULTISPECIES: hypothetical protein [unclassified Bradyrhizobium]|uniref:hypothetical protein n=1 Tax=unclassified Bradyrhizobium TaxID=2631580 RepID=UPI0028F10B6D|nr:MULTISPECIES: hypothetical protein [unclassified Bradyrhizobium]